MNHEEILDVIDTFFMHEFQVGLLSRKEDSGVFMLGIEALKIPDPIFFELGNRIEEITLDDARKILKKKNVYNQDDRNDKLAYAIKNLSEIPYLNTLQKQLAKYGTKIETFILYFSSEREDRDASQQWYKLYFCVQDDEIEMKNNRGSMISRKTGIIESFSQFLYESASYTPEDIWVVCEVYPSEINSVHLDKNSAEKELERMENEWKKFYSANIKKVTKKETPPAPQKYAMYTLAKAIDHIKDRVHEEYASQNPDY